MSSITFNARVGNIDHKIEVSGRITPILRFYPWVYYNNHEITEFDLSYVTDFNVSEVAIGDTVQFTITDYPSERTTLSCIAHDLVNVTPPIKLFPTTCPICGAPLFFSNDDHRFGKCLNRGCKTQMSKNIRIMFAGLGINIIPSSQFAYEYILSNNDFTLPSDIFNLTIDNFGRDLNPVDVQVLITAIHSIRGNVGIERIIPALNIDGWTHREACLIKQYATPHMTRLSDFAKIFTNPNNQQKLIPNINWTPFNEFLSLPNNQVFLNNLLPILEK